MPAKKSTSSAAKAKAEAKVEPVVEIEAIEEVVEEKPKATKTKEEVRKKEFKNTDGIKCTSITSGGLYMVGLKTDLMYSWLDSGDVIEVEYQDLLAEVRMHGMYAFRPRFIVDDEDFVAQHPELDTLYASLYSKRDLKQILQLPPEQLRQVVSGLPEGAKDALKAIASDAIARGEFDSMNRIKILDEIFGTQLLLKLNM